MRDGDFELFLTDNEGNRYPEVTLPSALYIDEDNPTFAVSPIGEEFWIKCEYHGKKKSANYIEHLGIEYYLDGQRQQYSLSLTSSKTTTLKGVTDYINGSLFPFIFQAAHLETSSSSSASTRSKPGMIHIKIWQTIPKGRRISTSRCWTHKSATQVVSDASKKLKVASASVGVGAKQNIKTTNFVNDANFVRVVKQMTLYYHTLDRLSIISPPHKYEALVRSLPNFSRKIIPPRLPSPVLEERENHPPKRVKTETSTVKKENTTTQGEEEEEELEGVEVVRAQKKAVFVDLTD
eukprot:Nk52_evm39s2506 gene=Nk52_evmTU39s2506